MKKLNFLTLIAALIFAVACTDSGVDNPFIQPDVPGVDDPNKDDPNKDDPNGDEDQTVTYPIIAEGENPESLPLISSSPALFTQYEEGDVVIRVNVAGTPFEGKYESFHAHTGVITAASKNSGDWKYVKTDWGKNSEDTKLVRYEQTNIFYLILKGGVRKYYGIPMSENVKQLAFVFRSSNPTSGTDYDELKDNGSDIFITLSEGGLDVSFTSPANGDIWEIGQTYTITAQASAATSLKVYQNGSMVQESAGTPISFTVSPAGAEDIIFKAEASNGAETVSEEVRVAVLGQTQDMARPADAKDGVTVNGTEATFVLYAPGKESVVLLGEFNDFAVSNEHMMKRDGDYFWTTVSGLQANTDYAYQFLVDESIRVGDPYGKLALDPWNDKYITASTYPNMKAYPENASDMVNVFSTSPAQTYNWAAFDRPDQNALAVYELLFRDFSDTGDINGAMQHLDYLENLGINAIELMPISEFDGNNSWGYNPCFYFAPDKAYGSPEMYKNFINECHKRGIAVIVDVVFNHATGQFPWAKMWWNSSKNCTAADNPFFNVDAPHDWSVYHDFKHLYPKTKEYFRDVLQYWLREYNIDGYRFDLTKGFVQNPSNYDAGGYSAERIGILKYYADAIREVSNDAYIIFEHFCDTREENELAAYKNILLWSNNALEGYKESAMGWRGKDDISGGWRSGRMNNIETHDEERIGYKMVEYGSAEVKKKTDRFASHLSAVYAFHFLSPYPKMLWQFGELGYDYSIEYSGRTDPKPVRWDYYDDQYRRKAYDNISKIISFRTDNEDMYGNSVNQYEFKTYVSSNDFGAKQMVYRTSGGSVVVVANFSSSDTSNVAVKVTENGEWTNLLTGAKVNITDGHFNVAPKAGELYILVKNN